MNLLRRIIPSSDLGQIDLENVKAGNKKDFDEMILGHTRLAASIVNRYIRKHGVTFLVDELDGAAFEGIVIAVDRIRKGHLSHDNFTGYIIYYIHEYIRKELKKLLSRVHQSSEPFIDPGPTLIDLWDQLSKITKTDFEKKVIKLRSQKYTDKEVAVKLNVSETTVARTRHKLKKRFTNERMARRV